MNESDKKHFMAIMLGLAENYGQTLTPAGIALRFQALSGFSIAEIEKAAMAIMKSRKFSSMPTVADFLEHLGGGNTEDRGQVEAGKVWDAIGRVGGYRSVVFDDPVTQAVVERGFGGWIKLCESHSDSDRGWFMKDFAKMYGAYSRQGVKQYGHLSGRCELSNSAAGYLLHIPKPVAIGDVEAAGRVLALGESSRSNRLEFVGEIRKLPYSRVGELAVEGDV